jgi:hypothetical protein
MRLRESLKRRHHLLNSDLLRIMQRAATEWGEPGPKNHPGIQQFPIIDDIVGQTRGRFIQHRHHQTFLNIGACLNG